LNNKLSLSGLSENHIHAGPLIRKERKYKNLSLLERKRIFNFLYNFARSTDISYRSIIIEKKQLAEEIDLYVHIARQLSAFLKEHIEKFLQYESVIVYYDFGQKELIKILVSVFNSILNNVEFREVVPANYKLFQAADIFCSLELLSMKAEQKTLSKSELHFFSSERNLYKSYLRAMNNKRLV
jgi:hypothetical protein